MVADVEENVELVDGTDDSQRLEGWILEKGSKGTLGGSVASFRVLQIIYFAARGAISELDLARWFSALSRDISLKISKSS